MNFGTDFMSSVKILIAWHFLLLIFIFYFLVFLISAKIQINAQSIQKNFVLAQSAKDV